MYILEKDNKNYAFYISVLAFSISFVVPPTGLIPPDQAPEYAKTSLSFVPSIGNNPFEQEKIEIEEKMKKIDNTNRKKKR